MPLLFFQRNFGERRILKDWNIKEILKWTSNFFKTKKIENARLNAELIISHILKINRLNLYLQFDRILTVSERKKIKELILRRATFEPLQYVLGECEFYGNRIIVNSAVLIPRPETELLVERIIKDNASVKSFLEIGTGSGAVAIALKMNFPESKADASDISEEALAVAKQNSDNNGTQINFIKSDIFSEIKEKYEIIVSNPPYISAEEYGNLSPEITEFEPKIALLAKENGLFFYKKILSEAKEFLCENGCIYFEIGSKQADKIREIALKNGFENISVFKDLNGFDRIMRIKSK
ncbi:MAG: peptide chain release factor N(5)-glutamine methyltransferase [Candidatus Cloacimonadota bacterium]|nr:MAG: peptide chain release factor N(5)-glutamine methyltransferase [Candidatus Cloacimonadota bacterium]